MQTQSSFGNNPPRYDKLLLKFTLYDTIFVYHVHIKDTPIGVDIDNPTSKNLGATPNFGTKCNATNEWVEPKLNKHLAETLDTKIISFTTSAEAWASLSLLLQTTVPVPLTYDCLDILAVRATVEVAVAVVASTALLHNL